jgi:hypothetical protein
MLHFNQTSKIRMKMLKPKVKPTSETAIKVERPPLGSIRLSFGPTSMGPPKQTPSKPPAPKPAVPKQATPKPIKRRLSHEANDNPTHESLPLRKIVKLKFSSMDKVQQIQRSPPNPAKRVKISNQSSPSMKQETSSISVSIAPSNTPSGPQSADGAGAKPARRPLPDSAPNPPPPLVKRTTILKLKLPTKPSIGPKPPIGAPP